LVLSTLANGLGRSSVLFLRLLTESSNSNACCFL